jgi:hypothetical protein
MEAPGLEKIEGWGFVCLWETLLCKKLSAYNMCIQKRQVEHR